MQFAPKTVLFLLFSLPALHCTGPKAPTEKADVFTAKEIFNSPELNVTQISENAFIHTSFLQTNDFGNVPCNGLLVRDANEVIVFDTPTTDAGAQILLNWITDSLKCRVNAVLPTHFHDDCLGGLKAFHANNIPSYANAKTIALAIADSVEIPQNSFTDSLSLQVGQKNIVAKFVGEGHTKDNVVGYFPGENVLFGGCLIKELNASKGYLGDANVAEWSATVSRIKTAFPDIKRVVPGHGVHGDTALLTYTMELFKQ